jgi:hypothetical protein
VLFRSSLPANRLISSPSGQQHIITATSNQNLKSLTLNPASGGGSWLTSNVFSVANPVSATNTLVINDTIVLGSQFETVRLKAATDGTKHTWVIC